jgi:hypothetical protein
MTSKSLNLSPRVGVLVCLPHVQGLVGLGPFRRVRGRRPAQRNRRNATDRCKTVQIFCPAAFRFSRASRLFPPRANGSLPLFPFWLIEPPTLGHRPPGQCRSNPPASLPAARHHYGRSLMFPSPSQIGPTAGLSATSWTMSCGLRL